MANFFFAIELLLLFDLDPNLDEIFFREAFFILLSVCRLYTVIIVSFVKLAFSFCDNSKQHRKRIFCVS